MEKTINILLITTYVILGLAVMAVIASIIRDLILDWKNTAKKLAAIITILLIITIGYFTEPSIQNESLIQDVQKATLFTNTSPESIIKLSGALIKSVYILGGVALLSLIASEISRMFR